jgi:hypothetical protein
MNSDFATHATGVLTSTGVFTNAQTITVGNKVYTTQTSLTQAEGNVLIGASAAATLQNLFNAINGIGTPGTTYGQGTLPHPSVRAIAVTATTLTLESRVPGVVGNHIPTTETQTNASFGGATLSGGVGAFPGAGGNPVYEMLR